MLVFVHINKTAGSTVRYILRSSYGARHCDVEPWHAAWEDPPFSAEDLRRVRKVYADLVSIAGHRIAGHVDLDDDDAGLRYFTFVRDPVKTTASRFQYHVDHRKKQGLVFDEWIQRDWIRNAQTQRLAGVPDAGEAIRVIEKRNMFVGLADRFDESMLLLKTLRVGDLDISYKRVNVAKRNTLAADLLSDERSRQMLAEANDQDLELYRYAKEVLYPDLQREYGPALDEAVAAFQSGQRHSFNRPNLVLYRAKQHGIYRPLLRLHRRKQTRRAVDKLLARR